MSFEHRRVLPVARRDLHHHVILVERVVDRRHLALAEGVVERVVDRRDAEAEPRGRGAVDRHVGLEAALLLVGIDVLEHLARSAAPPAAAAPICRARRCRRRAAYIDRSALLCRPPVRRSETATRNSRAPGDRGELAAQPRHDAVGGDLAFGERLQRNVDEAGIGLPPAGDAGRPWRPPGRPGRSPATGRASPSSPGTKCSGRPGSSRSSARCPAPGTGRRSCCGTDRTLSAIIAPQTRTTSSGSPQRRAEGDAVEGEHRLEAALGEAIEPPVRRDAPRAAAPARTSSASSSARRPARSPPPSTASWRTRGTAARRCCPSAAAAGTPRSATG